ncbi:hypothetical protein M9Y10_017384 [Tritrichomonas musculus]|uniref:Phosphoglycerate mutase n=1 Tax=Tritrichomonas musculus TaxID=1915356 RepID=A0ABR2HTI1_9EUKA
MFWRTPRIIIVRHGESETNVQQICGGWIDTPLTEVGIAQAHQIANIIKQNRLNFDVCISSVLSRAVKTRNIILEDLNLVKKSKKSEKNDNGQEDDLDFKIPVYSTWKLNESHSGALTGMTFQEVTDKYGPDAIQNRFSVFDNEPPPVPTDSSYNPANDPLFANAEDRDLLPLGESLCSAWKRAEPYWKNVIEKVFLQEQKKSILVVTHGNIIRAIMKYCENLTAEDGMRRRILPNCAALVYDYKKGQYINRQIYGEPEAMKKFKLVYREKKPKQENPESDQKK